MRTTLVLNCPVDDAAIHLQRLARRWRDDGAVALVYAGEREAGGAAVSEWVQADGGPCALRLVDDPGFGLVYLEALLPARPAADLAAALAEAGLLADPQAWLDRAHRDPHDTIALAAAALAWRDVDPQPARRLLEALLTHSPESSWPGALMAAMVLGDRALQPTLQACVDRLPDGPLRDGFDFLARQWAQAPT